MSPTYRLLGVLWCAALLMAATISCAAEFTSAVRQVDPAVVTITADDHAGSGFIFSPDGYILTNRHVIEPDDTEQDAEATADSITIKLQNDEQFPATITHLSTDHDLCVLKIDRTNLPAVQFASSDRLTAGQDVAVIGAPLGLEHSVTRGVISALAREIDGLDYLQIDAALNEGNSGGPVINEDGQVIGVAVKMAREGQSVGFAIPSAAVMQFLQANELNFSVVLGDAPAPPPTETEPPHAVEPEPTQAVPDPEAHAPAAPPQMPISWLVWPIVISFVVALLTAMVIGLIFARRAPTAATAAPAATAQPQQPLQQQPQATPQQEEDLSDIDIDLH